MARTETITYKFGAESFIRQMRAAYQLASEYEAYARSIGCCVYGDELVAYTEEQAKLLHDKWEELTNRLR